MKSNVDRVSGNIDYISTLGTNILLSASRRSIFHLYGANKINVTFNPSDYLYNIIILFHETQFYFMIIGNDSEITQIGAAYINDKCFSQYLLPSERISTSAIDLTGLTVAGSQMYKECEPVPSTSKSEGLSNFLQWLSSIYEYGCRESYSRICWHTFTL